MSLQRSYTLLAPIYDAAVARATEQVRRNSLTRLDPAPETEILLTGIGSGLDIPWLPPQGHYHGIDLTPAMLRRAQHQDHQRRIALLQGDAMVLPYRDACFDWVVMHLILAVVPEPSRALAEATRVLKPGGSMLILDKFLPSGPGAWWLRAINPLMSRIATRTDVALAPLLATQPGLAVLEDSPAMLGQWFRHVLLRKTTQTGC